MYIEDDEIFDLLGKIEDITDERKKIKRGSENEVEERNKKNEDRSEVLDSEDRELRTKNRDKKLNSFKQKTSKCESITKKNNNEQ